MSAVTLRSAARQLGVRVSGPYRVALGHELMMLRGSVRFLNLRSVLWHLDRVRIALMHPRAWVIWQCESDAWVTARRGLTARAAERRMLRDAVSHALGSACSAPRGACSAHPYGQNVHEFSKRTSG